MDSNRYREFLLSRIPTARIASGGRQINCRCMYCPDSKDPKSAHMYISIPQTLGEPSLFYCHKCHVAGVVTFKSLIEWDIYDDQMAMDLIEYNKLCSTNYEYRKYSNSIHYRIRSTTTTENDLSAFKLKYINNRLGCNFTYKELRDLKIILNLSDLFSDNNIQEFTRDVSIIEQLDYNFLGFLSIDNAFLNMRRLCDEGLVEKSIDKRYINYGIFNKANTSERFYTIPTNIFVGGPNRTKIHIAEGPFDILSIYKNVRHEEPGIYSSIGGSNYKGLAMYFLEKYKLPYSEFHYYPDNDKFGSNNNMYKIAKYLKPMNIPMYIHRNMYPNQKDFGVSSHYINETIEKVEV